MKNIYDFTILELSKLLQENNIPKFRAVQIWNWLYIKKINQLELMSNLDKKTLNFLRENIYFSSFEEVTIQSDKDKTQKALLRLNDGELIETVLMKQNHGNSVCVTTQVGCKMGCSFCASQIAGFTRNLTTGEIVQQVLFWEHILNKSEESVTHIVVMGIGEPFDNYLNLLAFLDIINDQNGLKIGARHITISTSGIVPKIYDFANYPKQINLAISLHSPNNKVRSNIMKINNQYPIEDIIAAVKYYVRETNRRVTFEYIMIHEINDSQQDAYDLVDLIRGINCHVNLIPFNPVDELQYSKSSLSTIEEFEHILLKNKIQVSVRKPKGENIDGACGQLRHKNV